MKKGKELEKQEEEIQEKQEKQEVFDLSSLTKEYQELSMTDFAPSIIWSEIGQTVEGVIVNVKQEVGDNKQDIITLKTAEGERALWGNMGLRRLFEYAEKLIGITVCVRYEADVILKKRKKPMKVFSVKLKK